MDDAEKKQLEDEFARLSEELDSAEAQARTGQLARERLDAAAREHARFLARSREVASKQVVR
jgi:cell division protein FtsL